MDSKTAAAEIKRLRAQSKDKSIPQEARNELLDRANEIEYKMYEASKKMAKGGAVKKMAYGGAAKMNGMHKMPDGSMMKDSAMAKGGAVKKMAYGGATKKMAKGGAVTKMAKGGYANCGASVKASGGKK